MTTTQNIQCPECDGPCTKAGRSQSERASQRYRCITRSCPRFHREFVPGGVVGRPKSRGVPLTDAEKCKRYREKKRLQAGG